MIIRSITLGSQLAARRVGLALLIYLVNLSVAFVISIPIFGALRVATANSGYGPELVQRFDVVLWADVIEKAGDALLASWTQFLWVVPLVLVWKVAVSVGLIHALRDGGLRSFWEGVGRFMGKATLMALLYLTVALGWLILLGITVVISGLLIKTTPGSFVVYWIVTPAAVVFGLGVLDLMHDYGRINLVVEGKGAVAAWLEGIKYPFRRPGSILVYVSWAVLAVLISVVAAQLHASLGASMASVWLLFLAQQIVFFARSAVTVAWFGSEVCFFERTQVQEAPLIVDNPASPDVAAQDV